MTVEGYSVRSAAAFVNRELGVSSWLVVGQDRIDGFARCTEDLQWIHVDPERCRRESPFGGTIAHGLLTLSLLTRLQVEVGVVPPDAAQAVNYGFDKVRFLAPVRAGRRIRNRVRLLSAEPKEAGRVLIRTGNTVEIEAEDKPALVAENTALLIPAPGEAGP